MPRAQDALEWPAYSVLRTFVAGLQVGL